MSVSLLILLLVLNVDDGHETARKNSKAFSCHQYIKKAFSLIVLHIVA